MRTDALNIAVAQINPTVGDVAGNVAAVAAAIDRAAAARADLLVLPELVLPGYYPGDLLEDPAFLARLDAGFDAVLEASRRAPSLVVAFGTARRNAGPGRPLFNALVTARDGQVLAEYRKQLLPNYNVFQERRHFEPGPDQACVLEVGGCRVGFLICEDGWNDAGRDYPVNPLATLRAASPDLVVSINASPSDKDKRAQRHALLGAAARRHGLPLLYVNLVGGQDQLVFDGASFALNPEDGVVFEAASFAEDFQVARFAQGRFVAGTAVLQPELPAPEFYRRQIVLGLRDYARRCGFRTAVVGSSGGIDSALTLALAAEALGPDNVTAVTMPSAWSSEGSVSDSVALCRNLGVKHHTHPIRDLVDVYAAGFVGAFNTPLEGLALENLQARARGTILMEYSNAFGALLLTTGNKSEISVGFCTIYGDTNGGLGLIGDLYKTEVFELSRHLNAAAGREIIPEAVLVKPPSAELAPGQKDSDRLPPYEVLDLILKWHIEGALLPANEYAAATRFVEELRRSAEGAATVERVLGLVARAEYKRRQAPPVIRVRPRAFGIGRQMPIAAKY